MTDTVTRGAWMHRYHKGLTGTTGTSLDSERDQIGWAIRGWKEELIYSGFGHGIALLPNETIGDASSNRIRDFQKAHGLVVDGCIGRLTGEMLLRKRLRALDETGTCWQVCAQESGFDVGAVGSEDPLDRGPVQKHLYPNTWTLDQAIRPSFCLPYLATYLKRMASHFDAETAIASWNVGEGGAAWWFDAGKPQSGSPSWWHGGTSLAERCWSYVGGVKWHTVSW